MIIPQESIPKKQRKRLDAPCKLIASFIRANSASANTSPKENDVSVRRYSVEARRQGNTNLCRVVKLANKRGEWVKFEDYAALEALYQHTLESRNDWRDIAQRKSREASLGSGE